MPLPTSGPISLNDIAGEQGIPSIDLSLRSMSNTAGFIVPDAISEFYGYSSLSSPTPSPTKSPTPTRTVTPSTSITPTITPSISITPSTSPIPIYIDVYNDALDAEFGQITDVYINSTMVGESYFPINDGESELNIPSPFGPGSYTVHVYTNNMSNLHQYIYLRDSDLTTQFLSLNDAGPVGDGFTNVVMNSSNDILIIADDLPFPTPTPTKTRTPSVTASVTPSISVSITTSITPTPTYPTPSITPSRSPSVSVSRTVTPSVSVSRTVTPSVTPSISVSRTASVTPSPSREVIAVGIDNDSSTESNITACTINGSNLVNFGTFPLYPGDYGQGESPVGSGTYTIEISFNADRLNPSYVRVVDSDSVEHFEPVDPAETSVVIYGCAVNTSGGVMIYYEVGAVPSPTPSISRTPSVTPSVTPSISVSRTVTPSVSVSRTASVTPSITPSISVSRTVTPSVTPSITPSISVSRTVTPSVSVSRTASVTPSVSVSRSRTPSVTPSITASISRTPSTSVAPSVFNIDNSSLDVTITNVTVSGSDLWGVSPAFPYYPADSGYGYSPVAPGTYTVVVYMSGGEANKYATLYDSDGITHCVNVAWNDTTITFTNVATDNVSSCNIIIFASGECPSPTPSVTRSRTPSITPPSRTPTPTPTYPTPSVTKSVSVSRSRTPSVTPTKPVTTPSRTPTVTPSPSQTEWRYYVGISHCYWSLCDYQIGSDIISNSNSLTIGKFFCYTPEAIMEILNTSAGEPTYYTYFYDGSGYSTCDDACANCS